MLLGWVAIQVILKLLQILAHGVAQSQAIFIMGHLVQVLFLTTCGAVVQKLSRGESLFETFGPLEVMDLCVPSDPHDVQTFTVLRDTEVFCVQQFPVHIVT